MNISWHIGKEAVGTGEVSSPPFRAFFTWIKDDAIVRTEDYSFSELEAEIERIRLAGEDTSVHEAALRSLKRKF